jgi:regulation of enolase protein 1 (concanavalin A-like superfamily)
MPPGCTSAADAAGMSFARCTWLNAPKTWRLHDGCLVAVTDAATDFWRETHYGFTRDTGHFFGCDVAGDFTTQLRIRARYDALYDQAGIMVRLDEKRWIKAGIEKSDGQCLLSSVLTVGQSDWATGLYDGDPADFWMRATVSGGVIRLQVSPDGQRWPLVRLAPFPKAASYRVGPMCCTPERAGLEVEFSAFQITPPLGKDLHDLS